MIVVDHYLYLPGKCGICHSSNLPTVDTGIDLDWENSPYDDNPSAIRRFYICADCCINLAMMVSDRRDVEFAVSGTNKTLKEQLDAISRTNVDLLARLDELENALRVVKSLSKPRTTAIEITEDVDVTSFEVAKPKPKR